jgi:hypothetical protein
MCLIITAIAALAATAGWYFRRNVRIGTLALIYWGAALMWLVDGLFRAADGKVFFDFSLRDAALGAVVVLCGLCVEAVMLALQFFAKHARLFDTEEQCAGEDT